MNLKPLIQKIFAIDDDIRYVAVADRAFRLVESKMRENTPTLTSGEIDRDFFSWVPPVMIEGVSKLRAYFGSVLTVAIQYEKLLAIYIPVEDYVIALTVNVETKTSPFQIARSVKTIVESSQT